MKAIIKNYLKRYDNLLDIASFVYNIPSINALFKGNFRGTFLKNIRLDISGGNATVKCGRGTRLINCRIYIKGNNVSINVGERCILQNLELWIEDDNGCLTIGNYTTIEGGHIAATEGGMISIGDDCMFSSQIQIRNGDSHSIYDLESKMRINHAKDVKIGNHVWLGINTTILKGSELSDNTIVGSGTIISSIDSKPNCIYAGNPARQIRTNVLWRRER